MRGALSTGCEMGGGLGEPRVLVVGHLTEDLVAGGSRLGGAAAFAGLLAHRFGAPTTVLTAVDPDFPFLPEFEGIRIRRVRSDERTRFENRYAPDGTREQRIRSRAAPIPGARLAREVGALPEGSAVLYAPVADELGEGPLPRPAGPGGFAAAGPQGLLRRWDQDGRIRLAWPPGLAGRLTGLDLVSLAEAEAAGAPDLPVRLLAITQGERGALVRRPGRPDLRIPPARAAERDPTGAGDVFAAALAVSLWSGTPLREAGRLAAAAAALTVESPGTAGVPSLAEAARRAVSGSAPGSPAG